METHQRPSQRKYEVTFHGMKSIQFSQLSPSKRYLACSEGDTVIVWDLLRDKMVGVRKLNFDFDGFDFDEKETRLYICDSFSVEIYFFLLEKDGLREGQVLELQGYTQIFLYSLRTGHLVVIKENGQRTLVDLNTLRELKSFPSDCDFFSIDFEAKVLFFKCLLEKSIGYVDPSTLEVRQFEEPFSNKLFAFLGRSRQELFCCASQKMVILDAKTGDVIRQLEFPRILFGANWIIKWNVGFLFVATNKMFPFKTFCYLPGTERLITHGTHDESYNNTLQTNNTFTFDGFFSVAFENFLRVSRLDIQNSSAIQASKVHSPACLKISGNRSIFPRKRHIDLSTPSPFTPPQIDPTCSGFPQKEIFPSSSLMHNWPQTDQEWQSTLKVYPDAFHFKVIRCKINKPEFKISIRSKFDSIFGV